MKVENKTAYRTEDLRRFFGACVRHMGASPQTRIKVVYRRESQKLCSGWATLGGTRIHLRLPRPGNLSLIDLAYVLEHEVSHNLGVEHKDMDRECYNCHPSSTDQLPTWAAGLAIAVNEPKPKPTMDDRIARRAEKARRMLERWERKLKLSKTMRRKWATKVSYYEKKAASPKQD